MTLGISSLFAIAPDNFNGMWVFDDPAVGLFREPFASGADDVLKVSASWKSRNDDVPETVRRRRNRSGLQRGFAC